MVRSISKAVLLFVVYEMFLTATANEQGCYFNRQMEEQCGPHTYKVVKPMLDYFQQIRNELHQSEVKEKQLTELNSNLIKKYHEIVRIHEKLVKEAFQLDDYNEKILKKESDLQLCRHEVDTLQTQIHSQQTTIDRLIPNSLIFESYEKCKAELKDQSANLGICEVKAKQLNSSLTESIETISRLTATIHNMTESQKTVLVQLEESQSKLLKKENGKQLCEAKVDKLNRTVVQESVPSSCIPFGQNDGVHQITVSGIAPFDVLCDSKFLGPGWIVIQQGIDGTEDFSRSWAAYREGFGKFDGDFFLGLEKIYRLTNSRRHELYAQYVASNRNVYLALYDDFKISDESSGYALSLGEFTGNLDMLGYDNKMKFTTYDRDNDNYSRRCAEAHKSGWWFNNCTSFNFNSKIHRRYHSKMLIRPKV